MGRRRNLALITIFFSLFFFHTCTPGWFDFINRLGFRLPNQSQHVSIIDENFDVRTKVEKMRNVEDKNDNKNK